jgi:hypothetical protein
VKSDNDLALTRAVAIQINWEVLKATSASDEADVARKSARIAQLKSWADTLSDQRLRRTYHEVLGWAERSLADWREMRALAERAAAIRLPDLPPEEP